MEVSGQCHALAIFLTLGTEPQVVTEYEAGWVPELFGRIEDKKNLSPLLGIEPWVNHTIV
jgi:hypothetical protein